MQRKNSSSTAVQDVIAPQIMGLIMMALFQHNKIIEYQCQCQCQCQYQCQSPIALGKVELQYLRNVNLASRDDSDNVR